MSIPNHEFLQTEIQGTTLIARINRPASLNALNQQVVAALAELIGWLESPAAAEVRALILTGSGEKAFVAGADISEFAEMNPSQGEEFAKKGQKIFARLEALPFPVIAAVNGFALGGGLELALACDFIYGADSAKFGLPECTLGIMPGYGGSVRLCARVGQARALEMMMSGQMLPAEEALRCGLINRMVPRADLLAACLETAATMGSRAPKALTLIKRAVHEKSDAETYAREAKFFGELFKTEDKKEGVAAFMQKRKPQFKGR